MQRKNGQNREKRQLALSLLLAVLIAGGGTAYTLVQGARDANSKSVIKGHAYTSQTDDLKPLIELSAYVVEGTVQRVLPAEWTTPDKRRPKVLGEAMSSPDIQLRTPVLLSVETVFKGAHVPRTLFFSLPGGADGELSIGANLGARLEPGMKVVVFLSQASPGAGRWARISPLYPQIYFVVDGETLHGPLNDISRSEFLSNFEEGAES
jgi:hypothetical protein